MWQCHMKTLTKKNTPTHKSGKLPAPLRSSNLIHLLPILHLSTYTKIYNQIFFPFSSQSKGNKQEKKNHLLGVELQYRFTADTPHLSFFESQLQIIQHSLLGIPILVGADLTWRVLKRHLRFEICYEPNSNRL